MSRRAAVTALAVAATAAAAFAAGVFADQAFPEQVPGLSFHPALRGRIDDRELDQALRVIQAHYYEPRLDYRKLARGSIRGMVQSLGDPYSQYLDPVQLQAQKDYYAGRHSGMIGVSVNYNGERPVIMSILPGSPARQAGLQAGDVLVSIGATDTRGLTAEQASVLIRGPVGRPVELRIARDGVESDVSVERADFKSPTVQSARLEGDVLYLRVYQFGDDTLSEFRSQLRAGLPGASGLVLDLRDDGGGLVAVATGIISDFLRDGEAFEERGRDGKLRRIPVSGGPAVPDLPVAVLINGNSASSAEIVAGSLQARGRARLVGTRSFGKGSIQLDYRLPDGGDLHLTVEHWFLPDGRSVDHKGLLPDLEAELPRRDAMFDVVQPARGHTADTQLNRALESLGAR